MSTYLFETYGSQELSNITTRINEQLKKYLPIVKLVSAEFVSDSENQEELSTVLRIIYSISNVNVKDKIEINLSPVKPSEVYIGDLNSELAKIGGFE